MERPQRTLPGSAESGVQRAAPAAPDGNGSFGGPGERYSGDEIRASFARSRTMTIGIEEEVMLLDPETLDLSARSDELLERTMGDHRFKRELPAAQLEIVSPPLARAADVATFLADARRDAAAAADGLVRLACSGVHPFASPEGEFNSGESYAWTLAEYGPIARRQLVFALQVHVAVPGADRALAVYNAMRSFLPEMLALSANAPFYAGADSELATVRPKIAELLPRQGVPPVLESWDDYAAQLAWGARVGTVPSPRVWWWELRPHPVYGTLEVRVPDAQTTVDEAVALVALVHSLAAWLAARCDAGDLPPPAPTWRIEENRWSAARHGLAGKLADLETGQVTGTRDRLHRLVDELRPFAEDLGCAAELEAAHAVADCGGAERQRRAARGGDLRHVVADLAERFVPSG